LTRIPKRLLTAALIATALAACTSAASPAPPSDSSPSVAPTPTATPSAGLGGASTSTPPSAHTTKPRPSLDAKAIANLLTASITLIDVADTDLAAAVTYVDPSSGDSGSLGTRVVGPSEQIAESVPAGTYRIEFRLPASSATKQTCTIAVKDGAAFTFVAVPGAIAVSRMGYTPATAADLFVGSSPLCKG
jgi:hypothetical protein